ncbi:Bacillosamine/Legionaminic acid biosynthesis aminotransferase PglE [Minicystis rosea]|nr:Bacillosamine/Legionaminic acid biosynthesis aminotransferase PglE [Minicystis rosea]
MAVEEHRMIPVAAPIIGEREIAYVTDAVRSGWVSSIGPYIDRFEEAFAHYIGVRHAIAVSNGTVALHLALHALGVGPGDEVIVPDLTFAATVHTVLQTGAVPVLADVVPETWCLDPRAVERALTGRTKAIVPVHLFGQPADMPALGALARPRGIRILEDAAEAHGASLFVARRDATGASAYEAAKVGALGDIGSFSFYGNKLMTTGEGGMLTTDDDALARRCRFLKDHGMSPERRYYHTELAFNYRMTNLQAALGLAQLEQLETFIAKKRQIMAWYREDLASIPHLTLNPDLPAAPGASLAGRSVFWMISVVLGEEIRLSRDEVSTRLRALGIDTRPFFVPMSALPHLSAARAVGAEIDRCPASARLSARGLNLPSGCGLTREDVARVAQTLADVLSGARAG